jgi:serine O-acetyltransferase
VSVATNIELPAGAAIGPGLYIAHTGYIVLSPAVVLGHHCTLTQGVTIGHRGGGTETSRECPVIGNRVYIGPGAAVIGPLTIGDDALIGVNAVVTRSIPPRGVAVGNPARVISLKGSFQLIAYPGMDADRERVSALAAADETGLSA